MSPLSFVLKASSTCCLRDLLILNSGNLGALRAQAAKVPLMGTGGNFANKNNNKKLAEEWRDLWWLLSLANFNLLQKIYIKIINILKFPIIFVQMSHPVYAGTL